MSKGRDGGRYAYYHCRPKCHAVNIPKARLEGLFVDELERLQPTPGYMRLLKESVLRVWQERKAAVHGELEDVERKARTIHQKLDRLDETFIFARAIDLATYERQRDRLREALTLVQIDRHSTQLEELDVEGVLAFAERVLPKASDLWVHASLDQRQRLHRYFSSFACQFSTTVSGCGGASTAIRIRNRWPSGVTSYRCAIPPTPALNSRTGGPTLKFVERLAIGAATRTPFLST